MKTAESPELKTVRILISSPGDVVDERGRARRIIDGLRRRYAHRFVIKHVLWEDLPLQADMSFQEGIDLLLSQDGGVDIGVFILWSRLGSPVGDDVRRPDGSEYRSGTEREFELLIEARERSLDRGEGGPPRPHILVYRRDDENSFHEGMRGLPTNEKEEALNQKKLVESFFAEQFKESAHHVYDRPAAFSQRLRRHLQGLLDQMAEGLTQENIWDIDTQGAPFMGLAAFEPSHADVFFGREDEILEARSAFREQAGKGCAFLLLCGASGSGKSSLARAGVVPAIVENELDEQVAVWRSVVTTPFELAPDPISALVSRIAAEDILPELVSDTEVAALVEVLRRDPETACKLQLKPAFVRADKRLKGPLRLILVIDQLEELFASAAIPMAERTAFLAVLGAMARSGKVWVLATVRSDFYEQLQSEPSLVSMKSGAGQLDILPPGADSLRRLVEEPALLAGLRFEKRADGQSLSDVILRDAAAHPELLPLIEYLLRELYEQRDGNVLTFAAFKDLGNSVEEALGRRAEKVLKSLPPDARATLDSVLQALVTLGENAEDLTYTDLGDTHAGGEHVVRQRALLSSFPKGTPARTLIDAFVAERLFTAGGTPDRGATITVAHESLLRVWYPAVNWAERNRDFLHTRAHVAQRYKEGTRLLEEDPLFGAAKDHLARNPEGFPEELRTYIKESVRTVEEHRKRVYTAVAVVIAAVVALILYFSTRRAQDAVAGQLVAEAERNISQRDFARAEIAAARALKYRDTPQMRQLLVDARSGGVRFLGGSDAHSSPSLSMVSDDGLVRASVVLTANAPIAVSVVTTTPPFAQWRIELPASARVPDAIAFSKPAGNAREVAIAWTDGSDFHVDLRRLEIGKPAGPLRELAGDGTSGRHIKRIPSIAFHPSKPWIATSGEDAKLCLWDYSANPPKLLWEQPKAHDTNVHGIAFNGDGSLLASGGGDYKVKVWQTAQMRLGAELTPDVLRGHSDSVFAVAFSPDNQRLASAGYDRLIRIWDLTLKGLHPTVGTLSGHEGTVLALAFTDDSKLLTSGGKDDTIRLWDVSEGRLLVTVTPGIGEIRSVALSNFEGDLQAGGGNGWSSWSVRGHSMATRLWNGGATIGAIAFDPSGRFIAAGGNDGKVRIWDAKQGFRSPVVLDATSLDPELTESINGITFSADGRWLAAGGEARVIHIWERTQGGWAKVKTPDGSLRHDGAIWGLCFDPLGRWLASSNTEDNLRVRKWKVQDWTLAGESSPVKHAIWSLACAPGGLRVVGGDGNGTVTVRETERLGPTSTMVNVKGGEANVWSVAVTESPVSILSGNSDGKVRRWIPANDRQWTGSDKEVLETTSDQDAKVNPTINSISYSRKHGWIAAGGDGPSVEIYGRDLKHIRSLKGHSGTIWFVTFDPVGTRLAYGGTGRILRIFDLDEMDRMLATDTPDQIYRTSQETTGLSVEDDKIVVTGKPRN